MGQVMERLVHVKPGTDRGKDEKAVLKSVVTR
jgi:hypothetical protein